MKITSPFIHKVVGLLAAKLVRHWLATLDYKIAYYDPSVDTARPEHNRQMIYVFWHEYMLPPIHMRSHSQVAMLISRHRDGDLLWHAARHLGFQFVRGSSYRGGANALREMLRQSGTMSLAITPDGPRGPRRVLAQGPIYLASKLGMPLVPMGIGLDRPWRLKSWDRFAIPRPFTRARGVIGPPLDIPPDLDRDRLEHYRLEVQHLLNRLTGEAEAWAESGLRKPEEQILRPEPSRHRLRQSSRRAA